jgi:hypothetical protein|tara:strand:+ start:655 stop:843 length:189 start_codon:yes stop_codon:yes gene_type:complete
MLLLLLLQMWARMLKVDEWDKGSCEADAAGAVEADREHCFRLHICNAALLHDGVRLRAKEGR